MLGYFYKKSILKQVQNLSLTEALEVIEPSYEKAVYVKLWEKYSDFGWLALKRGDVNVLKYIKFNPFGELIKIWSSLTHSQIAEILPLFNPSSEDLEALFKVLNEKQILFAIGSLKELKADHGIKAAAWLHANNLMTCAEAMAKKTSDEAATPESWIIDYKESIPWILKEFHIREQDLVKKVLTSEQFETMSSLYPDTSVEFLTYLVERGEHKKIDIITDKTKDLYSRVSPGFLIHYKDNIKSPEAAYILLKKLSAYSPLALNDLGKFECQLFTDAVEYLKLQLK